jgi:hypothetical protein
MPDNNRLIPAVNNLFQIIFASRQIRAASTKSPA